MTSVQRYERLDDWQLVSGAVTDSDGFMRDSPIVARTGIYIYQQPDGTIRREYRPSSEVFSNDSMASFMGKPIVVDHPKTGKVNSDTVRQLAIGTILSPGYRKDDENIGCDIVIHDPKAIGERRALSLGYRVDLEETAGVTADGQPYDAIQRNIRINHLAVVKNARAGIKARLNLDGDEIFESEESEGKLMKVRIDSKEYELDENVANYISSLQSKEAEARTKMDAANAELASVKDQNTALKADAEDKQTKLDTLTAERDGLKAKVDASEDEKAKAVEEAVKATKEEAKERAELEKEAEKAKLEKTDSMSNVEIKAGIVKAAFGENFNLDGASEAYINGAYNAAKEMLRDDAFKAQAIKAKGVEPKEPKEEKIDSAESARTKMIQRQLEAFKTDSRLI